MPELSLADLIPQITAEWAAIDLAGITAQFQSLAEKLEDMMDGWIVLGERYVKPIDWDELWLLEPEGVGYAAYRHHITGDQRILVGTGPTPARAARLITEAVRTAAGEVDHEESRRNHGLPPRDGAARRRAAVEREASAARIRARVERDRPARSIDINDIAPYNAGGSGGSAASATTFALGTESF